MTTAEMITLCRTRMGEDSTTSTAVSDAQILSLLNERMAELCADTNVLVSGWYASTVSGQQQYSVPPEYTSVEAIQIYRTTGDNKKQWLAKVPIIDTNPARGTGSPDRFALWGLNVSGDNSPAFWLDPIPDANGTNDLYCYGRQLAKTMVSGGQGPEVRSRWQYLVVDGALELIYLRFAENSPATIALADRMHRLWEAGQAKAMEYITLDLYSPAYARDTMRYLG
jgi:hypothetical protein